MFVTQRFALPRFRSLARPVFCFRGFFFVLMPPKAAVKRGVFDLSPEELQSPNKLCKFADNVPMYIKTGDEDKDEDLKLKRSQFQKSVNLLWRNPDLCWKNVMWLEEKIKANESKVTADMFKTVSTLGALDETWCCAWIVSNSRIKLETLEGACIIDPESWKQILVYALKCLLTVKVPLECKKKAVCGASFEARNVQCGSRLGGFMDETLCDEESGLIDWKAWGCYEPLFVQEEPNLRTLRHRPTGHIGHVPAHVHVQVVEAIQ